MYGQQGLMQFDGLAIARGDVNESESKTTVRPGFQKPFRQVKKEKKRKERKTAAEQLEVS